MSPSAKFYPLSLIAEYEFTEPHEQQMKASELERHGR